MAQQLPKRQRIRIPLVGTPNSRIVDSFSSASTSSGIVGIGVVGVMIIGSTVASDLDQRFINTIFDKIVNPMTGKETFYVMKRPGFAAHSTPSAGNIGTAVKVWSSQGAGTKVISAFGGTNSTIYDATTSKGAITGKAKFIDEAMVGSTPTILIPSTDETAWYYQDGGAPTEITDADFPSTITGRFVSMDGYIFIMTPAGRIYNSDLNSVTAWQATNFLTAQMYPDFGVGLARYKDQIVAFGKETIEFFHITDNIAGSPLARTAQGFVRIGCASQYGYAQMEDTVTWISSTDKGGCSIYMLDGYQPKRISTSAIEAQLSVLGPSSVRIHCIKLLGKTIILATVGTNCFMYQVEDQMWCQWNSGAPLWTDIAASTAGDWRIYSVSENRTDGKVYVINPASFVYQDDGMPLTMTIQTSRVDLETDLRKFLHRLVIIGDTQASTSTLYATCSDDDYRTFCSSRSVDLSDARPYLTQLGSFRRRAFKFTHSDNTPCRIEGIELELSVGQN
jgi:hypothetical protein